MPSWSSIVRRSLRTTPPGSRLKQAALDIGGRARGHPRLGPGRDPSEPLEGRVEGAAGEVVLEDAGARGRRHGPLDGHRDVIGKAESLDDDGPASFGEAERGAILGAWLDPAGMEQVR